MTSNSAAPANLHPDDDEDEPRAVGPRAMVSTKPTADAQPGAQSGRLATAKAAGEEWLDARNPLNQLGRRFEGGGHDWHAMSRQVWQLARLTAGFLLFAMLVGWPLGSYLAHRELVGSGAGWSILGAYPAGIILFALVVPSLVIFVGYVLSRAMTMAQAGEDIADAARYYVEPDIAALREVETVGTAVREQIDVLNDGLSTALMRLADVEAMIRQHVEAIETAGEVIETRASGAVERVASERTKLMELTETLNLRADDFANAIAERTEANIAALERADTATAQSQVRFDERLNGLETAAGSALVSFQNLVDAISGADNSVKSGAAALMSAAEKAQAASEQTVAATQRAQDAATAAVSQSVVDAAALANLETVKQAVAQATQASGEEAVALARAEATRIAQEAVKSAGLEIEKIAKQAGETIEATAEQAAESARQRKAALARAHAELEAENARLEKLIDEQQARAERLANTIALQTEKLAAAAHTMPVAEVTNAGDPNSADSNQKSDHSKAPDHDDRHAEYNRSVENPKYNAVDPENSPMTSPLRWRFGSGQKSADTTNDSLKKPQGISSKSAATLLDADQSVQSPREDLERLGELARDLAERRAQKAADPVQLENHDRLGQNTRVDYSAKSWKDILAAADDAEPLDLGNGDTKPTEEKPAEKISTAEANAINVITRLQNFTQIMDSRLYGASPPGLVERFEKGDRNVFANRLLRLNESDVKKRIRLECAKDRAFEKDIRRFLSDFDGLLEEAAQSEFVDDELREYLGSPLGRMYLLIGEIVGYFA